ncbi:hypothetical protein ABIA65_004914 [Mycolicibacterium sp. 624]
MRIKMSSATSLLAAGAIAVALAAAPSAAAESGVPQSACSSGSPGTECVSPGNTQINDSLSPDFTPQYPDFALFGFGGHFGRGHR